MSELQNNTTNYKVLFLLRFWPYYGGGESVTRSLIHGFLERNIETHVMYLWNSDNYQSYEEPGLIECQIPNIIRIKDTVDIDSRSFQTMTNYLKEYVDSKKISHVINQWWPLEQNSFGYQCSNVPIIKCWHGCVLPSFKISLTLQTLKQFFFRKRYYRNILASTLDANYYNSDALVFLSKSLQYEFIKYSYVYRSQKPVFAINNPLSQICRINYILDITKKKNVVLVVARMYESTKKISRILKAWNYINNDIATSWELHLVGDGPDIEGYKDYVVSNKLKNVIFKGAKNPVEDYEEASIFVLCSENEGWGMTVIEALSYGVVPIVLDTYSSAREIISDGYNGVLLKSRNPKALGQALSRIVKDERKRAEMAKNGIESIKKYSLSSIVDCWIALFDLLKK